MAALVLGACGEKQEQVTKVEQAETVATQTETTVGGTAECSQGAISDAGTQWGKSQGEGEKASLPSTSGSYACADGWAVAFPNVGSGQAEVTVTVVFQAEGQFWVPQDRAKVCGNNSPVPKSLYQQACQTN